MDGGAQALFFHRALHGCFCGAKQYYGRSRTERPFCYLRWFRAQRAKGFYGALPHTPPPFEKGGRKLHSLAIAAIAGENFNFFAVLPLAKCQRACARREVPARATRQRALPAFNLRFFRPGILERHRPVENWFFRRAVLVHAEISHPEELERVSSFGLPHLARHLAPRQYLT